MIDVDKFEEHAARMNIMQESLREIVESDFIADTKKVLLNVADQSGANLEDVLDIYVRIARSALDTNLKNDELGRINETVQTAFPVGSQS